MKKATPDKKSTSKVSTKKFESSNKDMKMDKKEMTKKGKY